MFDAVPVKVWLLLLIGAIAWMPARYVLRHVVWSPSRRDITQSAEDLSWRSPGAFIKNSAILIGLAALAIFIFTDAAAEFARSPSFMPILLVGFAALALWSVVKGVMTGSVEPMVRGASWRFDRTEQPKRYWASMTWNALLAAFMLVFGMQSLVDAPVQALRDRCHDWKNERTPQEEIAACDRLLADHAEDDRSGVIASRGSAYYRAGDYRRAGVDYTNAIRLDPKDSSSHYNLGLVHEQIGDRRRAFTDYSAALGIDPENVEALQNRGFIHLDSGRFDQAIADFTEADKLQPTNVFTLANRGVAYAWKNDRARAEQDFAVVRKSDPSNLTLLHGEAVLAMVRGETREAIRLLGKAIAQDPRDAWALSMRAAAYRRLGDHEKMRVDIIAAQRLR
ncbi:tetratricopeptide repeat protein [Sphingomonas albertensis]|uniref:Tetratricopeptide repeat protein n=1 Tax=Sphingomonas albertensis TaxID=2762591 RepID=A0ABR7ALD1_9SPHN|nr:tetratricopeptide repeat protein [Sphingomonas albertensis]MBC3941266.1 tetratricopeptide repeat protein [Sphingomonas albertensis]